MIAWILLANKYAPPSYFTSVFGIGIIALLLYARLVLHEIITAFNYFGMALIVIGTVILGVESIPRASLSMAEADLTMLLVIIVGYMLLSVACVVIMLKISHPYLIGVSFGLFTGGAASLDPVLKGVAQNLGGIPGYMPSTMEGWCIFFLSFIFASASFIGTQWGFMKNSPASIQVPVGSSVYVCFPIIIQGITLPGFDITLFTIAGMLLVVVGILFLTGITVFSNGMRAEEAIP
jgi:drug/metabolite transporter (DMT)-like permease